MDAVTDHALVYVLVQTIYNCSESYDYEHQILWN